MLKRLVSDTLWYGLSSIMGRVVNYALVPLYTATLPIAANGVITSLYAYVAFFNVVLTFGMETAYFRFARGNEAEEKEQAARGQTLIAGICLLFLVAVGFVIPWLRAYLGFAEADKLVWLMAAILVSDALSAIPLARLRLQRKPKVFGLFRLGTILLFVMLSAAFLLVAKPAVTSHSALDSWLGTEAQPVLWVFFANLLANLPLLFLVDFAELRFGLLVGAKVRYMLKYAWPIVLMGLAGMANQMLGLLQLQHLLPAGFYPTLTSLEAVGVYGQCYKLSMFMAIAVQAFRLGAEPFFFSMASNENKEVGFALVMRWFIWACLAILVCVCLSLDWLAPLVLRRPEYLQGLGVVPILLVANLWLGVYYNLSVWFKLTDRTTWGTWLSLGGMAVTVVLNYLLIPIWGYIGAAWATLFCYFSMAVCSYVIGQRYMPVPYQALKLFLLVLFWFVVCWVYLLFASRINLWQSVLIRGIIVAAFINWLATQAIPLWKARSSPIS